MSILVKTPAIVLRYTPVFNTSRVVNWLTPRFGRISTIIKGSQRPKSQFIGQYDLFYTCELIYYANDRRELLHVKECTAENPRRQFRRDWKAAAAASYFCDLIYRVSPPHDPVPLLYTLLEHALDEAHQHGGSLPGLFGFELKLLEALGFKPVLDRCANCLRVPAQGEATWFGLQKGGLLCEACRPHEPHQCLGISPPVLQILRAWNDEERPDAVRRIRCSPEQLEESGKLLGLFLEYHLDHPIYSRGIALDILKRKRVQAA